MDELDLGATVRGFTAGQKLFNRYTLIRQLGRGGMGVVWRARDESLERDVAIKMLPEIVANDPGSVRELKRETARNQQLSHPHILRVYDFAEGAGLCGITMEIAEGGTLTSRRLDQPGEHFEAGQLREWVRQLCEGLDHAHQRVKVVHRDLKPANLMLTAEAELKITDFGIAASLSESVTRVSKQAGSSGTPVYMSPQQMMGDKPAVTDDIYALGATLYELLTGKPPFYAGNIVLQVQSKRAPTITERRKELEVAGEPIPLEWEETIAACLAKEPADRPQSAGEVAARLGLTEDRGRKTEDSKQGRASRPDEPQVERLDPKTLSPAQGNALGSTRSTSKTGLYIALAVGVIFLVGLGWYFGLHVPEQKRLAELARLEQAGQEAEAAKLRTAQERAAAEARTRQEQIAADAKAKLEQDRVAKEAADKAEHLALETRFIEQDLRYKAVAATVETITREIAELEAKQRDKKVSLTAPMQDRQRLVRWLREALPMHPATLSRAKTEKLLTARANDAAGVALAEYSAAITKLQDEIAAQQPADVKEALTRRQAADNGDTGAMYLLGVSYMGSGVPPQDDRLSTEWFLKAAEKGHVDSQSRVGEAYYLGSGVPKNYEAAVAWWRKAAAGNNASAMRQLGYSYTFGQGVEVNLLTALDWHQKAVAAGEIAAQSNVAQVMDRIAFDYMSGKGVKKDLETGLQWQQKSYDLNPKEPKAAENLWYGMIKLAEAYQSGDGAVVDLHKSLAMFQAAQKFLPEKKIGFMVSNAMLRIGNSLRGERKSVDGLMKALPWYEKAVATKDPEAINEMGSAMSSLADHYREGTGGVAKNYAQSRSWAVKNIEHAKAYGNQVDIDAAQFDLEVLNAQIELEKQPSAK